MHQIKTFENQIKVYFYFPPKKTGCPLKRGKFGFHFHAVPKACVHDKGARYIGVFLWNFDGVVTGSMNKFPLLQGACYKACAL